MAKITTGQSFNAGDQITSTKLNNIIGDAKLDSDSVTGTTLNLTSGQLKVATDGISSNEIANNAVGTNQISDDAVTFAKLQNIATSKVIGRTSAGSGNAEELSILDQDDMSSDSNTALATQQSIKAYVDNSISSSVLASSATGDATSGADVSTTLTLSAGTWLVRADYTNHESAVGGSTLTIDGVVVHTMESHGDPQGTSQAVLFGFRTITKTSTTTITISGADSNGYTNSGLIMAMAWKTA